MIGNIGFKYTYGRFSEKDKNYLFEKEKKEKKTKKEIEKIEKLKTKKSGQNLTSAYYKNAKNKFIKQPEFIKINDYKLQPEFLNKQINELKKNKGSLKNALPDEKENFEKAKKLFDEICKNELINTFFVDAYKLEAIESKSYRINGRFTNRQKFIFFFENMNLPPHYFFYVTVYSKNKYVEIKIDYDDFESAAIEAYDENQGYYEDAKHGHKILFSS